MNYVRKTISCRGNMRCKVLRWAFVLCISYVKKPQKAWREVKEEMIQANQLTWALVDHGTDFILTTVGSHWGVFRTPLMSLCFL